MKLHNIVYILYGFYLGPAYST